MKLTNTSPRLVFIQVPSGLLRLVPLAETEVDPADEVAVQAALDGPFKWLVDNGQVVLTPPDPPPPPPPPDGEGGATTGTGLGLGNPGRKR